MNQNTLSKFKRVQYTKDQINQMKLQLQSKNTQQDFKSLNNNMFKKINTQYVNNGQLQIEFDPTTNKIFFNDVSSGTKYFINANTGDTDLNVTLEGKTVNNMTINNLNSQSILLNATDGNQYNIETDIKTTDQEQNVQDDRLDTLEEQMKHIFENLQQYVTPQILFGQYFFSTQNYLDQQQDYKYNDINKLYFRSLNSFQIDQKLYIYPQFYTIDLQSSYISYIQGFYDKDSQPLNYNQYVETYPTQLSTNYTQDFKFLNNTCFYEGGIFFFQTQQNNQIYHFNDCNFDLVQVNSGCDYCHRIKELYENFTSLNLLYDKYNSAIDGNIYQFKYSKLNANIGVFICLTRTGDFDLTKIKYNGSQSDPTKCISEKTLQQYDSQFFKDQIIIAYEPETITQNNKNYTFDITQQADTFCIKLQKMDFELITACWGDESYQGKIKVYKCNLNFDYTQLIDQVNQMEEEIQNLQDFQQSQIQTNTDFNTRITTNTNNISTNTNQIQTLQNQLNNLNTYIQLAGGIYYLQEMNIGFYRFNEQLTIFGDRENTSQYISTTQGFLIIYKDPDNNNMLFSFNGTKIQTLRNLQGYPAIYTLDLIEYFNTVSNVQTLQDQMTNIENKEANDIQDLQNEQTTQNTNINTALNLSRQNFGDIQTIQTNYINKSFLLGEIKQMLYQGNTQFSIGDYVFMLCNGQSVDQISYPKYFTTYGGSTPNLNNIFLQGKNLSQNDMTLYGSNTKTLTVAQIPAHAHWIDLNTSENGQHQHRIYVRENSTGSTYVSRKGDSKGGGWIYDPIEAAGAHTHNLQGSTQYKGDGELIDFRPRYFNVCYYICVKTP